jgi:hypothetical protein
MSNYKAFLNTVTFFAVCLLCGCATLQGTHSSTASKASLDKPIALKVKGTPGEIEIMKFHSHTISKRFEQSQIRHEKEEIVDFTLKTEVKDYDEKTGITTFYIEALEKDGYIDLHDLAFPEVGETMVYALTANANVVSAGNYPTDSIFYVPPVSLPKRKVKVGETWTMSHVWRSSQNGMMLSLDLLTIFKQAYHCGGEDICAELELSGEVILPSMMASRQELKSTLAGRMLVSTKTGSIIWSYMYNDERFIIGDVVIDVKSCLEGRLEKPAHRSWPHQNTKPCTPKSEMTEGVPGFI